MYKNDIAVVVERYREELSRICEYIFSNPEVGYEEYKSSKILADFLKNSGFELQYPYCGFDTAFRAEYGSGDMSFCVMCEYDALPKIGHACGHNLIATAGIAAALAIKELMDKNSISAKLIVMGTPAEEAQGGKIDLLKAGAFEDIDACVLCHPFSSTGTDPGELAVSRFDIEFHGRAAHAAACPEEGINALDAMNLAFAGVNAWRQHIPESSRVHGIITSGGAAANIIPDLTKGFFYLRSLSNEDCEAMEERFENIVKGAALMTGCEYKFCKRPNSYLANKPYPNFDEFIEHKLQEFSMNPVALTERISTDYGNVSQKLPGCNFFFSICEDGKSLALHSEEFKQAAGTPYAFEQCLKAGQIMASSALAFFDKELNF